MGCQKNKNDGKHNARRIVFTARRAVHTVHNFFNDNTIESTSNGVKREKQPRPRRGSGIRAAREQRGRVSSAQRASHVPDSMANAFYLPTAEIHNYLRGREIGLLEKTNLFRRNVDLRKLHISFLDATTEMYR